MTYRLRRLPRHGTPWLEREDRELIEADPRQLKALAARLGRSHTAVVKRRGVLRQRGRAA